jgi:hypothetical protein
VESAKADFVCLLLRIYPPDNGCVAAAAIDPVGSSGDAQDDALFRLGEG